MEVAQLLEAKEGRKKTIRETTNKDLKGQWFG